MQLSIFFTGYLKDLISLPGCGVMTDARAYHTVPKQFKGPLRVIALITLWSFLFTTVFGEYLLERAWTSPVLVESSGVYVDRGIATGFKELNAETFHLPQYLGRVTDAWLAPLAEPYTKDTSGLNGLSNARDTIIHIQDAHCNYYAQHTINDIIEYLNEEYGLSVVNIEGGKGDYDLSVFTEIRDKRIRKKVADYFVKEGIVNGAEFFAINNPEKITLWGIEETPLYLENLNAYRQSLKYKEDTDRYLKSLNHILTNLKRHIFSRELLDLDSKYAEYKADKIKLKDYLAYLINHARQKVINVKSHANLYLLYQSLKEENKIDFKKANLERDRLVDELQRVLSKFELEELVVKTVGFKKEMLSQKDFYAYLAKKAASINLDLENFPELQRFIIYISLYDAIDKTKVMQEIDALENKIRETLYRNDKERKLNSLSRNFALMKNMFNISLKRDDYEYYKQNKSSFDARNYIAFINKEAPLYKITAKLDGNISSLDRHLKNISKFYECAFKRDDAFLENIKFNAKNTQAANQARRLTVIVTGGFHTKNLSELFKKNNISYVTVMPNFKNKDGYKSPYFKLLAGKNNKILSALAKNVQALAWFTHFCGDSSVVHGSHNEALAGWVRLREAVERNEKTAFLRAGEKKFEYRLVVEGELSPAGFEAVKGVVLEGMQVCSSIDGGSVATTKAPPGTDPQGDQPELEPGIGSSSTQETFPTLTDSKDRIYLRDVREIDVKDIKYINNLANARILFFIAYTGALLSIAYFAGALLVEKSNLLMFVVGATVALLTSCFTYLPLFRYLRQNVFIKRGTIFMSKNLTPGEVMRLDWSKIPSENQWNSFRELYKKVPDDYEIGLTRIKGKWYFIRGTSFFVSYSSLDVGKYNAEFSIHSHPTSNHKPSDGDIKEYARKNKNPSFVYTNFGFTPYNENGMFVNVGATKNSIHPIADYIIIPFQKFRGVLNKIDKEKELGNAPTAETFAPFALQTNWHEISRHRVKYFTIKETRDLIYSLPESRKKEKLDSLLADLLGRKSYFDESQTIRSPEGYSAIQVVSNHAIPHPLGQGIYLPERDESGNLLDEHEQALKLLHELERFESVAVQVSSPPVTEPQGNRPELERGTGPISAPELSQAVDKETRGSVSDTKQRKPSHDGGMWLPFEGYKKWAWAVETIVSFLAGYWLTFKVLVPIYALNTSSAFWITACFVTLAFWLGHIISAVIECAREAKSIKSFMLRLLPFTGKVLFLRPKIIALTIATAIFSISIPAFGPMHPFTWAAFTILAIIHYFVNKGRFQFTLGQLMIFPPLLIAIFYGTTAVRDWFEPSFLEKDTPLLTRSTDGVHEQKLVAKESGAYWGRAIPPDFSVKLDNKDFSRRASPGLRTLKIEDGKLYYIEEGTAPQLCTEIKFDFRTGLIKNRAFLFLKQNAFDDYLEGFMREKIGSGRKDVYVIESAYPLNEGTRYQVDLEDDIEPWKAKETCVDVKDKNSKEYLSMIDGLIMDLTSLQTRLNDLKEHVSDPVEKEQIAKQAERVGEFHRYMQDVVRPQVESGIRDKEMEFPGWTEEKQGDDPQVKPPRTDVPKNFEIELPRDWKEQESKAPPSSDKGFKLYSSIKQGATTDDNVTCGDICEPQHRGAFNSLNTQLERQFEAFRKALYASGEIVEGDLSEEESDRGLAKIMLGLGKIGDDQEFRTESGFTERLKAWRKTIRERTGGVGVPHNIKIFFSLPEGGTELFWVDGHYGAGHFSKNRIHISLPFMLEERNKRAKGAQEIMVSGIGVVEHELDHIQGRGHTKIAKGSPLDMALKAAIAKDKPKLLHNLWLRVSAGEGELRTHLRRLLHFKDRPRVADYIRATAYFTQFRDGLIRSKQNLEALFRSASILLADIDEFVPKNYPYDKAEADALIEIRDALKMALDYYSSQAVKDADLYRKRVEDRKSRPDITEKLYPKINIAPIQVGNVVVSRDGVRREILAIGDNGNVAMLQERPPSITQRIGRGDIGSLCSSYNEGGLCIYVKGIILVNAAEISDELDKLERDQMRDYVTHRIAAVNRAGRIVEFFPDNRRESDKFTTQMHDENLDFIRLPFTFDLRDAPGKIYERGIEGLSSLSIQAQENILLSIKRFNKKVDSKGLTTYLNLGEANRETAGPIERLRGVVTVSLGKSGDRRVPGSKKVTITEDSPVFIEAGDRIYKIWKQDRRFFLTRYSRTQNPLYPSGEIETFGHQLFEDNLTCNVGRSDKPGVNNYIVNDKMLSNEHFAIKKLSGNRLEIKDRGSSFGTNILKLSALLDHIIPNRTDSPDDTAVGDDMLTLFEPDEIIPDDEPEGGLDDSIFGAAHVGSAALEAMRERMEENAGWLGKRKGIERTEAWKLMIEALEKKNKEEDDFARVRNALFYLRDAGFSDDQLNEMASRILLIDVRDANLEEDGDTLSGAIIRDSRGVLRIVLPRRRFDLDRLDPTADDEEKAKTAVEVLGNLLHEIVEVELLESGMTVEEAHWQARCVEAIWKRNPRGREAKVAVARAMTRLRDVHYSAVYERKFENILREILAEQLSLPENADFNAVDLSRLGENEESSLSEIRKQFIQKLKNLRKKGFYFSREFIELLNALVTDEQILDQENEKSFVRRFGHFDVMDLVLITQRLHTISENLSKYNANIEELKNGALSNHLKELGLSNAQCRRIRAGAWLDGERWNLIQPSSAMADALEAWESACASGNIDEASSVIEEAIARYTASDRLREDINADAKAVCEHFGINMSAMEDHFIRGGLRDFREETPEGENILIERASDTTVKDRVTTRLKSNFRYYGIHRILRACQRLPEHGIRLKRFIYKGADALTFQGEYDGRKVAIKINSINANGGINSRPPEELRDMLDQVGLKTKENRNFATHARDAFMIELIPEETDIIEVSEYEEGPRLSLLADRGQTWNLGLGKALDLCKQFVGISNFLITELDSIDIEAYNIPNYIVSPDGTVKLVDYGHIWQIDKRVDKDLNTTEASGDSKEVGRESILMKNKLQVIQTVVRILCGHMWGNITEDKKEHFLRLFVDRFGDEYHAMGEKVFNAMIDAWNKTLRQENRELDLSSVISSLGWALEDLAEITGEMHLGPSEHKPAIVGATHKDFQSGDSFSSLEEARNAVLRSTDPGSFVFLANEPTVMDLKKLLDCQGIELGLVKKRWVGKWALIRGARGRMAYPAQFDRNRTFVAHVHSWEHARAEGIPRDVYCRPSDKDIGHAMRSNCVEYIISEEGLWAFGGTLPPTENMFATWEELESVDFPLDELHVYFEDRAKGKPQAVSMYKAAEKLIPTIANVLRSNAPTYDLAPAPYLDMAENARCSTSVERVLGRDNHLIHANHYVVNENWYDNLMERFDNILDDNNGQLLRDLENPFTRMIIRTIGERDRVIASIRKKISDKGADPDKYISLEEKSEKKIHVVEVNVESPQEHLNTVIDLFVDIAGMEIDRYKKEDQYPGEAPETLKKSFLSLLERSINNFSDLKEGLDADDSLAINILQRLFNGVKSLVIKQIDWESLRSLKKANDELMHSL